MKAKLQFYVFLFFLTMIGFGLTIYKIGSFGFPLFPGQHEEIWIVEAKIKFTAHGGSVNASFFIPTITPGYSIHGEDFASTRYGFTKTKDGYGWRANWHARKMEGPQTLYYRMQFFDSVRFNHAFQDERPRLGNSPFFEEPFRTAADALIQEARSYSADILTFTEELLKRLNSPSSSPSQFQNVSLLLKYHSSLNTNTELILDLMARAKIPVRIVRGLFLEDGLRNQSLFDLIQVHDGSQWFSFNPITGARGLPKDFFIWQRGGKSLFDLEGGGNSNVSFSIEPTHKLSMLLSINEV